MQGSPQTVSDDDLPMRAASVVMDLPRLGCLYQYRLSFMRTLMRRVMGERWTIENREFELDSDGFGHAIYEVLAPGGTYSFVVFSHYLDSAQRSDRVIANAWDMTVSLVAGVVDDSRLQELRKNVPRQEAGRLDASCIVLSRANKSSRNFDYVVSTLAAGEQPSARKMAKVGYLYRTTAVYGSGKFGMADWEKVRRSYTDFARPFSAEMFTCYMIRQFSLDQADFLARTRSPDTAVGMSDAMKRYVGIGNATGLGMAPYLVNHPLLITRWIEARETALARVLAHGQPTPGTIDRLLRLTERAIRHLGEIETGNTEQNGINQRARVETGVLLEWLKSAGGTIHSWQEVADFTAKYSGIETQELVNTLLIELHPELVEDLEDTLCVDERHELNPEMSVAELCRIIEIYYAWVLRIDYSRPGARGVFWYRSEEKMEPRLGLVESDAGADREMTICVASAVRACYDALQAERDRGDETVADFLVRNPGQRATVRRIQTMSRTRYGDIHANLKATDVLPIHLLRCKLSFFGVGKFDPRSRLWVRNTMFQGAPIVSDIGNTFDDDWCFPVMPD